MSLFKGRRSRTGPSSVRPASPLIPFHRESLLYPVPPIRVSLSATIPNPPHLQDIMASNESRTPKRTDSKYWMSQFGAEPPNDVSTFCMGVWVPCALYGKTHWRLNRIAQGDDPMDDAWHSKDGCNGCCWAHYAASCFCIVCCFHLGSGILTGMQRSQIRGLYGIDGNVANDIAAGIFCQSCTLMNNDREVRARQGEKHLRNGKKYRKHSGSHGIVNEQPHSQPQMSYAQPGDGQLHELVDMSIPTNAKEKYEALSKKTNKKNERSGDDAQIVKASSKILKTSSQPSKKEISGKEVCSKTEELRAADTNPIVIVTYIENEGTTASKKAPISCVPFAPEPKEKDCNQPPTSSKVDITIQESSKPEGDDCHSTVKGEKKGSSSGKKHNRSYIHDFSGSPVDKAVLEYFEKEEKRSKKHKLEECTPIISLVSQVGAEDKTAPPQAPTAFTPKIKNNAHDAHEHDLAHCTPKVKSEEQDLAQHDLAQCTPIIKTKVQETPQHDLAHCTPKIKAEVKGVPQHNLAHCDTLRINEGQELPHHDLAHCETVGSKDEKEAAPEHDLAHCTLKVPNEDANTPTHSLTDCERLSPEKPNRHQHDGATSEVPSRVASYSVGAPSKSRDLGAREHRLASCPTPPVILRQEMEEGQLDDMDEDARYNIDSAAPDYQSETQSIQGPRKRFWARGRDRSSDKISTVSSIEPSARQALRQILAGKGAKGSSQLDGGTEPEVQTSLASAGSSYAALKKVQGEDCTFNGGLWSKMTGTLGNKGYPQ